MKKNLKLMKLWIYLISDLKQQKYKINWQKINPMI